MPGMQLFQTFAVASAVALSACSFHGSSSSGLGADASVDTRPPDARVDAPPDAPLPITLRETETDTVVTGHTSSCLVVASTSTQAETYERTFPLDQFSITGDFLVSKVVFAANSMTALNVTVEVGFYAGSVGDPTLNPALMTWLATELIDVPDGIGQSISTPITATIPAGAVLLVGISAPSYLGHVGMFSIAGTDGDQILPSYYTASSCGTTTPSTRDGHNNQPVGNFLIDVVGFKL